VWHGGSLTRFEDGLWEALWTHSNLQPLHCGPRRLCKHGVNPAAILPRNKPRCATSRQSHPIADQADTNVEMDRGMAAAYFTSYTDQKHPRRSHHGTLPTVRVRVGSKYSHIEVVSTPTENAAPDAWPSIRSLLAPVLNLGSLLIRVAAPPSGPLYPASPSSSMDVLKA
jgi:hypothetical protein